MSAGERRQFARAMLADPSRIGAVAPSSPALARAMVGGLAPGRDQCVIEFGPGTGAFTGAVRSVLADPALYLGIEQHGPFVERLSERFADLRFAHDSAERAAALHAEAGLPPVGAVVSGLPFASLPAVAREEVIAGLDRLLPPGGRFHTFQYVHAYALPAAVRFRRRMAALFGPPDTHRLVMANLPPALVLGWQRPIA